MLAEVLNFQGAKPILGMGSLSKLLEKEDLELMKEIIEDDDIEFDLEKINEFYNDRKLQ